MPCKEFLPEIRIFYGKTAIAHSSPLPIFENRLLGHKISTKPLEISIFPPSVGHRIAGFLATVDVAIHGEGEVAATRDLLQRIGV